MYKNKYRKFKIAVCPPFKLSFLFVPAPEVLPGWFCFVRTSRLLAAIASYLMDRHESGIDLFTLCKRAVMFLTHSSLLSNVRHEGP